MVEGLVDEAKFFIEARTRLAGRNERKISFGVVRLAALITLHFRSMYTTISTHDIRSVHS